MASVSSELLRLRVHFARLQALVVGGRRIITDTKLIYLKLFEVQRWYTTCDVGISRDIVTC